MFIILYELSNVHVPDEFLYLINRIQYVFYKSL